MAVTMGGVNSSLSSLNRINSSSQRTMQRIATGSNYPNASYGTSAYSILQRMNSRVGALSQSVQNTQNATSMLKTAAGATENTVGALTSIREQLIKAANGTNTDADRSAIQENINQLVKQIDSNANVEYNGKNLLDGSKGSILIAGISGYEEIELGDMRSQALGLTDEDGNLTIDLSSKESIQSALEKVNNALETANDVNDSLSSALDEDALGLSLDEATTLGAYMQRLDYQASNYSTMWENELAAASGLGDADIAKNVTELKSQQTLRQLALFTANMFNHNRQSVLSLFQ